MHFTETGALAGGDLGFEIARGDGDGDVVGS
jgi:hypothetical protein